MTDLQLLALCVTGVLLFTWLILNLPPVSITTKDSGTSSSAETTASIEPSRKAESRRRVGLGSRNSSLSTLRRVK